MIKKISPESTYNLRKEILRPDLSFDQLNYPGDKDTDSVHFGYFENEKIIGIATLYKSPSTSIKNEDPEKMYRLRGMAVESKTQQTGIGSKLLQACKEHVADNQGEIIWCDARISAENFYKKNSFQAIGERYVVPGVGPHYLMYWKR